MIEKLRLCPGCYRPVSVYVQSCSHCGRIVTFALKLITYLLDRTS